MDESTSKELDRFRTEVLVNVGLGLFDLDITDIQGNHPVVTALESESLAVLMRRVAQVGGFANVFVRGHDKVRLVNVLPSESALFDDEADDMTVEPPAGHVSVGAFLDYLEIQAGGVRIPAILPTIEDSKAERPRAVEFLS